MIDTLIVDDDYRVAQVHAGYVQAMPGFAVAGLAHTAQEAYGLTEKYAPALVLLDLYLPDEHGLDLMRRLMDLAQPPDTIVISAARDLASVRRAMRQGAVGYLMKPFGMHQFSERLGAYGDLSRRLSAMAGGAQETEQADVDALFAMLGSPAVPAPPKGQSASTMRLIRKQVQDADPDISAAEVAATLGISRPTAQRYLAYLVRHGAIDLRLQYGTTGRPEHRYSPRHSPPWNADDRR
jgi:response regulator of citrate/malate metabolism